MSLAYTKQHETSPTYGKLNGNKYTNTSLSFVQIIKISEFL